MLNSKTNAGSRDRRILIQSPVTSKDDYNQDEITSWTTFATVWAAIKDESGSEGLQADQITASRITVFDIRYIDGVVETMRVVFDNDVYDIQSIQRPDRKRSLLIRATVSDEPYVEEVGAFSSAFSSAFDV